MPKTRSGARTIRNAALLAALLGTNTARGFIFCLIGLFLMFAAVEHDPTEAKGLEGILDTLARQTYGSVLLAITGLGLAAYGAYMFVEARYRQVRY